jgi:uncharacterized protein YndB with AHSA1/START domain
MTTNKAHKRDVRARMSKTGESYTAAKRQVARAHPPAPPAVGPSPLPPRQAEPEVSEDAIRRATGRGWDDWFRILDERGLEAFSHRDTARWLHGTHGVDGWWAQSVTVGYERARGLRAKHQTSEGFEVSVSKTLPLPTARVWEAIGDPVAREAWVGRIVLDERTARAPRYARFEVAEDGSRVLASVDPKGGSKSTLTITHTRLADAGAVEARRAYWRERLAVLAAQLDEASD